MEVTIEPTWQHQLAHEFKKPYFIELADFVKQEYLSTTVYPPPQQLFRAFTLCPFDKVSVVILGQDPYHNKSQANGLSFAVGKDERIPPSLQNIFKEIQDDLCKPLIHTDGDLSRFAKQGVLLLNATLTVRAHSPGSHQGKGWEVFTDSVIDVLSKEKEHLVFMLWGNYAKAKGARIDRTKHLVLESAHPSPFSAHNGFFGNKHFSTANKYLKEHGKSTIDWL